MKIGEIYRASNLPEKQHPSLLEVDGYPNFYYHTAMAGKPKIQFQRGIYSIGKVLSPDGERIPAIIVSSSPHRYGSEITPWEDIYEPDFGRVKYYGDNKSNDTKPEEKLGNRALLNAFRIHTSPELVERKNHAVPILFFERTPVNGAVKGYLKFHGYGVIEAVELITQYDVKTQAGYFSNYVFDMCVFSLACDNEEFPWDWINARRDSSLTNDETLKYAPTAWKTWLSNGECSKVRRHVYSTKLIKPKEQQPIPGSKDEEYLNKIYDYFSAIDKHCFELLAMRVTQEIFQMSGSNFMPGWITKQSGDGGIDFVARCDIGTGISRIKTIIIGQAKCENINTPTNGIGIARTLSRLKRGWIGVYVTTSPFSIAVQKEVIDDQSPIMLINGLQVVKAVQTILYREGYTLEEFLHSITTEYSVACKNRRPEEILFD